MGLWGSSKRSCERHSCVTILCICDVNMVQVQVTWGLINFNNNWLQLQPMKITLIAQGCCLTGARSPEAPKLRMRATTVFFKEPECAPKHRVFHSLLICPMTSIFSWNRSQNHSHNKFNGKQLWSNFAFITRIMVVHVYWIEIKTWY